MPKPPGSRQGRRGCSQELVPPLQRCLRLFALGEPDSRQTRSGATGEEKKLIATYETAALKQLRAAIAAGFSDLEPIRSSTELDSIRPVTGVPGNRQDAPLTRRR